MDLCVLTSYNLVGQRFSTDVPRRICRCAAAIWGKVEKKREILGNKKSSKSAINIICINNKMIRILAI
jgi:hypothetical protein